LADLTERGVLWLKGPLMATEFEVAPELCRRRLLVGGTGQPVTANQESRNLLRVSGIKVVPRKLLSSLQDKGVFLFFTGYFRRRKRNGTEKHTNHL